MNKARRSGLFVEDWRVFLGGTCSNTGTKGLPNHVQIAGSLAYNKKHEYHFPCEAQRPIGGAQQAFN